MGIRAQLGSALIGLALCAGCERFPEDPESTLARALERGTLRVGVSESGPWIIRQDGGGAGGLEGRLLTEFAAELGVEIDWHWGSVERHLGALERHELDVVAGELTQQTPWKKRIGLSIPYYTSETFVGVRPPAPLDVELRGATVAVLPGSALKSKLESRGAKVIEREDLAGAASPVAAESWALEAAGFRPTDIRLCTRKHVFAVPPGENAMLMRLEAFILKRTDEARFRRLLREAWQQ